MNNWLTIFGKFQVLQNSSRDSVWIMEDNFYEISRDFRSFVAKKLSGTRLRDRL